MADDLKIGSKIRLKNKATNGFLDTCEYLRNENRGVQEGITVQTSSAADRDHGSGTWQIVSATGDAAGTPVNKNMQLRLQNLYTGAGYLKLLGKVSGPDASSLGTLDPQGFSASKRYAGTVPALSGDDGAKVGPTSFALVPNPPVNDHSAQAVTVGAVVAVRCYLESANYLLDAYGPLSSFTLKMSYPATQTGLVFASPNVPVGDSALWEISLAP